MDLLDGDMGSIVARALLSSMLMHAVGDVPPDDEGGGEGEEEEEDRPWDAVSPTSHMWHELNYQEGSAVVLRRPYPPEARGISKDSVGIVRCLRVDGTVTVHFPHGKTVRTDKLKLDLAREADQIRPGAVVFVRRDVKNPSYGWGNVDKHDVGMVRSVKKDGEVEVDFVQSTYGWRCLLSELKLVPTDENEVRRLRLRTKAVVGFYSFKIGCAVRVKPTIEEPRHHWGQVRPGSVGRVAGVNPDTAQLLVNFPEADRWRAHPEDIEPVPCANAVEAGKRVRVRRPIHRPRYDWPDGVTHDSVGQVQSVSYDGRVMVQFATAVYPHRRYVFHLRELEPADWTSPQTTTGGKSGGGSGSSGAGAASAPTAAAASAVAVSSAAVATATSAPAPLLSTGFPEDRLLGVVCPITLDVMEDPVIAMDGETYERTAIESVFSGNGPLRSPLTNEVLESALLIPNRAMKRLIEERRKVIEEKMMAQHADMIGKASTSTKEGKVGAADRQSVPETTGKKRGRAQTSSAACGRKLYKKTEPTEVKPSHASGGGEEEEVEVAEPPLVRRPKSRRTRRG